MKGSRKSTSCSGTSGPTQQPRPPFMVAANMTEDTYQYAGEQGFGIMVVPMTASRLRQLLEIYHGAWRAAGHPGHGTIFLAFHMFVDPDPRRARAVARVHVESYFQAIMRSTTALATEHSVDYKGYDKLREMMAGMTLERLIETCGAWVGSPTGVREQIARFHAESGGFDYASLQVNFSLLPFSEAMRSLRLFAEEVIPHFAPAHNQRYHAAQGAHTVGT